MYGFNRGDHTAPYVSVHPRRKQELCRRLALQALKMQYGVPVITAALATGSQKQHSHSTEYQYPDR